MAFIPIDAKADVAESKKGKITPAQHAQLNAWSLANKTGIFDWGDRCESTTSTYSVSGGVATVFFKKGYVAICGRIVECEEASSVDVPAPSVGTVNGKIILRYNLGNSGVDEFEVTTKTGALVQQDLNDSPTTGIYEFELYSYTATPTTVSLSRTGNLYVPKMEEKLQEIEDNVSRVESRFNITSSTTSNFANTQANFKFYKFGNFVFVNEIAIANFTSDTSQYIIDGRTVFNVQNEYRPKERQIIDIYVQNVASGNTEAEVFCNINTDGTVVVGLIRGTISAGNKFLKFTSMYEVE